MAGLSKVLEETDVFPTIDAVPLVHGRWVEHPHYDCLDSCTGIELECSHCHEMLWDDGTRWRYCPNCGAKMDGGAE